MPSTAATIFAPQATRHMYEFGTTREQMAQVAVKNWANGALNPNAQRQGTITAEDVLASPLASPPGWAATTTAGRRAYEMAGVSPRDTRSGRPESPRSSSSTGSCGRRAATGRSGYAMAWPSRS
jgi:hypothetical protein